MPDNLPKDPHESHAFYYYMTFEWRLTPGPLSQTKPMQGIKRLEIGRDHPITRHRDLLPCVNVCGQAIFREVKALPGDNLQVEVVSWQRFESAADGLVIERKLPLGLA
jgi:hypothetical protein